MKFNLFEDAIKWSTVYFRDKNNQVVIRDGNGNIDYRKFDKHGFADWEETRSNLERIKTVYDDDKVLYDKLTEGAVTMSYDCPWQVEQSSPYREFIR